MPQKRRAQVADSHQKRLVYVVPTEESFDGANKIRYHIAGFWFADDSCVLQVLAHLDRHKVQITPNATAGYAADSFGLKL